MSGFLVASFELKRGGYLMSRKIAGVTAEKL